MKKVFVFWSVIIVVLILGIIAIVYGKMLLQKEQEKELRLKEEYAFPEIPELPGMPKLPPLPPEDMELPPPPELPSLPELPEMEDFPPLPPDLPPMPELPKTSAPLDVKSVGGAELP